jgi:hypothetical protein
MRLPSILLLLLLPVAAPPLRAGEAAPPAASPEQIQSLVQQLGARYLDERQKAAEALERAGAAAGPALIRALDDEDVRVRRAACNLLGRLQSAAAIPRLMELLPDPDEYLREAAEEALVRIGPAAFQAVTAAHNAGKLPVDILGAFRLRVQRLVEELRWPLRSSSSSSPRATRTTPSPTRSSGRRRRGTFRSCPWAAPCWTCASR